MKNYHSKRQILAALGIFSLIFVYFYRLILKFSWLSEDFMGLNFPAKYYLLNNFKEGIINFWNPYLFGGTPILADIQFAIFYPLNLFLIPLARPDISYMYWLLEMQVIFHLFLGGIFMFLLMRYLKVSFYGSFISAVIFSLLPFFTAHLRHVLLIETAIWLPLVFLFFHRALYRGSLKNIILASLVFSLMFLAGHPQIIYCIILFLLLFFLYFLISEKYLFPRFKRSDVFKKIISTSFILISAFLISAIQFFPYLEFLPNTARSVPDDFLFASSFSLNPVEFFITSFLPHFFGGFNGQIPYRGVWNFWEMVCYLGVFVLFLAASAFVFLRQRKIVNFLFYASFVSLFLSFGYYFFIYPIAYYLLPGLKFLRNPARFIYLYSFSLTIAAGLGFDYLTDKKNFEKIKLFFWQKKEIVAILSLSLLLAVIFFSVLSFFDVGIFSPTPMDSGILKIIIKDSLIFSFLFFSLITFLIFYFSGVIKDSLFKILISVFIIVDLFAFGLELNNNRLNPEEFFSKTPEIEYLESQSDSSSRLITNQMIYPNTALIYKIRSTEGYSVLSALTRYNDFVEGNFWPHYGYHNLLDLPNRAKLLGVCHFLSSGKNIPAGYDKIGNLSLYKLPECPPIAYLVHNYEIEKNSKQILKKIDAPNFDPLKLIILEEDPGIIMNSPQETGNDSLETKKHLPDYIEIESKSSADSFLFLSETYYPGWEAYIDGQKTKIYRANYLFRAIMLKKGEHQVKFIYNPRIFKIGAFISLSALLTIFSLFIYATRREIKGKF